MNATAGTGPEPASAAPAAVAALLGHGVTAELALQCKNDAALRPLLDAALRERLGEVPAELTPVQRSVAGLDTRGLERLALLTGCLWHAEAIAAIVEGGAVRALADRIGPDLRRLVLSKRARFDDAQPGHARPEHVPPLRAGSEDSGAVAQPELLAAAAAVDGMACLVAWCGAQVPALGARVLLHLPPDVQPTPLHRERGPHLVDRAAELAA